MKPIKHILITGSVGAGKSTVISHLLSRLQRPVYGFITRKITPTAADTHRVYMFPAGQPEWQRTCTEENLLGMRDAAMLCHPEVFDRLGTQLICAAKPDGVIVMDELGFMEKDAWRFQRAVLDALHGAIPVIAAVKNRTDVPFLNAVRACPNTALYTVTEENRNTLAEMIIRTEALFRGIDCAKTPK